jgi:hypothetical protein
MSVAAMMYVLETVKYTAEEWTGMNSTYGIMGPVKIKPEKGKEELLFLRLCVFCRFSFISHFLGIVNIMKMKWLVQLMQQPSAYQTHRNVCGG